jgi:ribosomal protein L14
MKSTLSIKKATGQSQHAPKQRVEQSLVGKRVILQTKSPSRICGEVISFENGWLVITGVEHRWLSDGSLSAPVTKGTFTLDRSVITYFAEVAE